MDHGWKLSDPVLFSCSALISKCLCIDINSYDLTRHSLTLSLSLCLSAFFFCLFFRSGMDYTYRRVRSSRECAMRKNGQVHWWTYVRSHHKESRASSCFNFFLFHHLLGMCLSETDHIWQDYWNFPCFLFLLDVMFTKLFFPFFLSEKLDCDTMNSKHTLFFNKYEYFWISVNQHGTEKRTWTETFASLRVFHLILSFSPFLSNTDVLICRNVSNKITAILAKRVTCFCYILTTDILADLSDVGFPPCVRYLKVLTLGDKSTSKLGL